VEVVVEPVRGGRTDAELRVREQALDRLRQHMGRRVPEDGAAIVGVNGDGLHLIAIEQFVGQVPLLSGNRRRDHLWPVGKQHSSPGAGGHRTLQRDACMLDGDLKLGHAPTPSDAVSRAETTYSRCYLWRTDWSSEYRAERDPDLVRHCPARIILPSMGTCMMGQGWHTPCQLARPTTRVGARDTDVRGGIMPDQGALRWLSQKAAAGLKEMPSNGSWAVSKVLSPPSVEQATGGARDTIRRASAAAQDKMPLVGDSLDVRLKRAREATERAQRAEDEALADARQAKELADAAKAANDDGRRRVRETRSEAAEHVKQRITEARRRADAMVEEEKARARTEADESIRRVSDDVGSRIEQARERAEQAQEQAESRIAQAAEQMAGARRLADEAAEAALAAAADARSRAEELVDEARRQAGSMTDQVADAQEIQQEAASSAAATATQLRKPNVAADVNAMTKKELMDLATAMGVERRGSMNNEQLVRAVNRESKKQS
jgi:colicin import membrane protein